MNVDRLNRSLKGLGCSCNDAAFGQSGMAGMGGLLNGLGRLAQVNYADMSWTPPSMSSPNGYFGNQAAFQPGTAANMLLNQSPDGPTPTGGAVFDAFTNNAGGTQPGVLALDPNATANNLSFIQAPPVSTECKVMSAINAHPLLLIGGVFGLFYLLNEHSGKHKRN